MTQAGVLVNGDRETNLRVAPSPRRLSAEEADVAIDLTALNFETTQNLPPLDDEIVGQDRALAALDLGLGIDLDGYNIFVSGLVGTGRMETIRQSLSRRLKNGRKIPDDWLYLNNFDNPDEPQAIHVPAGMGRQFKKDMERLVERLKEGLPKAFRQEDFSQEKERLGEKYNRRFQQQMERLSGLAKDREFQMVPGPEGNIFFVPLIDGTPPQNEEQLENLSAGDKERIRESQKELSREAARIMEGQQDMMQQLGEEVRQVERRFGSYVIGPMIEMLKNTYKDHPRIVQYLDKVSEHMLENLADFRDAGKRQPMPGPMPGTMMLGEFQPHFTEYQVNVIVDNHNVEAVPIILEEAPTYRNLFGSIERAVDRSGRLVTNFTQIKAGSLLKANGGYLVFNLEDALTEPFVYKNLKRALKGGQIQLESLDTLLPFSTGGLRPEPIPISTKVIVIGNLWMYLLLRHYDEDFASIFKIKADFGTEMNRSRDEQMQYARFIALLAKNEKLHPFSREAVAQVIRFGSRRTEQKDKLLARFSEVADVIREADYFARQESGNGQIVEDRHVRQALEGRVYRNDRIAEKIREMIADGTILVDTQGSCVGQVNGLAVLDVGNFAFGKPTRVTASVGLGSEGVINIEREAKLSGSTYDKGILILSGYLRGKYGQDKPLALSASLAFEQSYSGIDGDSASAAELFALLSSLAQIPIRQDIAITGSINQWGQIQAIGGVNEKIEGFFDVCRTVGLSGRQGVCIPASNVRNLVLRPDVRQAIADNEFNIFPIATVDEGLELLSGISAGTIDDETVFHGLVNRRLHNLAQELRGFGASREMVTIVSDKGQAPAPAPPRLPGDQP